MRHLKRETGSTNSHGLVLRCNQLRESIERMNEQIEKTRETIKQAEDRHHSTDEPSAVVSDDKERAAKKVDNTLVTQFERMCEMRENYTEMLHLNQSIYRKLVGAPMVEHEVGPETESPNTNTQNDTDIKAVPCA